MSNKIDDLPYRQGVGIALFNTEGKVFVGERLSTPEAWQMPQGGIDKGESVAQAAYRELQEETGISPDKVDIIQILDKTITYDLPPEYQRRFWGGKYQGQEQYWVAMRFLGNDSDIDLSFDKTPEFNRYRWISLEDTVNLIPPFKQHVYQWVIDHFKGFNV